MEKLFLKLIGFIKKEKILCIICLIFFLVTRVGYSVYLYELKYKTDEKNKKMYVRVLEERKKTDKVSVYLVEYENSKFLMNIYDKLDNKIEEEDVLKLRGKIVIPEYLNNPYEFNYKRYLNSMGFIGTISVYSLEKIGESKKIDFNILSKFRKSLQEKVESMLGEDENTIFNSMILGIKDYNNTSALEYFKSSGSSHFLSISGTHIMYYIYVIDIFILNFSKNTKRKIKVLFLILFNLMIGYQISLIRASIMYIIFSFDIKDINKYIRLLVSFLVVFSINPYVIFNASFIFSYLSIIAISIVLPQFSSYFDILNLKLFGLKYMDYNFLKFSKVKRFLFYISNYIFKSISFVLSIYLVTLPFQMYFFCEINFISILSNIIISPIISFELILGFLSLLLVYIPYVSDILILANNTLLTLIMFLVKTISSLEFLRVSVIKPDVLSIFSYYIILSYYFFSKYLYKYFSIKKVKRIKKYLKTVTIILSMYIISIYIKVSFFEEYVYFFNVGQGNMALLHKQNINIVVDLGSTSSGVASNILTSFLKAKNISKIDMIIITHMHDDHMNGVEEVIENVEVSKVIFSSFEDKNENKNSEFERMVKEKNISTINVSYKDSILFRDFRIDVLSPPKDKIINSSDNLNSNSLVLLISKKNYNYLFLGDATKETEEFMFKEKIYDDIIYEKLKSLKTIQIGHHGSNTSTSNFLLENVNNCSAIISSKRKKFGHPSVETIDILKKYNFDILITEKKGAIKTK